MNECTTQSLFLLCTFCSLFQAKGWPLICIFWSLWNFTLLYGNRGSHWLTFDHKVFNMFNSSNPSAVDFLSSGPYQRILITAIIVGVIVMVKRLLFSLVLGKRTCGKYKIKSSHIVRRILYNCATIKGNLRYE